MLIGVVDICMPETLNLHTLSNTMTIWNCYGYDTKKEMHDILSYMIETPAEAYARCKEQYPNFEIYKVTLRPE